MKLTGRNARATDRRGARSLVAGLLLGAAAGVTVACGSASSDTGSSHERDAGAGGSENGRGDGSAGKAPSGGTANHGGTSDAGPIEAPEHDAGPGVREDADVPAPRPDARHDAGTPPGEEPDAGPLTDGGACVRRGARFATSTLDHHFGPGQNFGQDRFPAPVLGPPRGGGACGGSVDVVSLGNGGDVTLAFDGNAIVDGPGPDFIVFENAFGTGSTCNVETPFAELATVSVSEDGEHWVDFPCTATEYPYGLCSGWHVVYANADKNDIDATDPAVAGGDPFDLSDVGLAVARYVKITDRADLTGAAGVYDLDAVSIVNALCP